MTISTKMFNQQTISNLSRLSVQLSELQTQVASGQKPIRPSTDPIATSKLFAAKDLQAGLERFRSNMNRIEARLSDTDEVTGQVQNLLIRLKELSIQASNDTLNAADRMSIRKEVTQHKNALVALANSRDTQGQALFGGYQTNDDPFKINLDGSVAYSGDNGLHSLPVSASLNITTGVDGVSSFMRVQTQEGTKSVFDIVQEFETSLEKSAVYATQSTVTSADGALLTFDIGPNPTPLGLRIEGPNGQADISADIVFGTMDSMIAAVNAKTELTGVRATAAEDGNGLVLLSTDGNGFTISHIDSDGVTGAEDTPSNAIELQQIQSDGLLGDTVTLVDKDSDLQTSLSGLDQAIHHFSLVQAQVGAYAATAQMQSELLARKEITVAEAISGITDADLTEVVTQLQSLLVNRDALRQVFAKVGQQSLFDLIR